MINRSKRRSIIFKFNFSFLRMARSISISNSAICHRTLSLPPPLSPGSMKVETFERKHWLQIPLSCRRFDSLPGIQIEFSLSRSNDPLTNDFFPPPSCIRKHSHRSRYVSLLLFSNRFSFFFFFVNERSQHRRDHRGRNFTSILRKRVRRTGFEE